MEYCARLLYWNIALTCFVGSEHHGISDYCITLQLQKSCFVGILSTGHHLITSIVWENSREEWSPTNRWVNAHNCVLVQLVVQFGNTVGQPLLNQWVNAQNCVLVQLVVQFVVRFGNAFRQPFNRWVNAQNCVVVQLAIQFGNTFRQPSFNRWVNAHNCVVVQLVIQSVVQFGNTLGQPSFNWLVNGHNCNLCFMFSK